MRSNKNSMFKANSSDVVGVGVDIRVIDGAVSVEVGNATVHQIDEVRNRQEVTHFIYVRKPNIQDLKNEEARRRFYQNLLQKLDALNGKYYLKIPKNDACLFQEVISENRGGAYSENLAQNCNLLYMEVGKKQIPACFNGICFYHEVDDSDENCQAISIFQTERLIAMRPSLSEPAFRKKLSERLGKEAICQKLQSSNEVKLFTARDRDGKIIGTMVANIHLDEAESKKSKKVIYMSDLILSENVMANVSELKPMLSSFVAYILDSLVRLVPDAKIVTLMAPGQKTDPLVACIKQLEDENICKRLSPKEQGDLGLFAYFVSPPPAKVVALPSASTSKRI